MHAPPGRHALTFNLDVASITLGIGANARSAGERSASRTEISANAIEPLPAGCARGDKPARQAHRDDLPSSHSMTSSARNRMEGSKTTPIFWAVRAFTANSKRVGPSMGRSPGAAPFKIRTT